MFRNQHQGFGLFSYIVFVFCATYSCVAQGPVIEKVEPPNWWAGHTVNPVRLLIRGKRLGGKPEANVSVTATRTGTRVGSVRVSTNRNYLFVDVEIDKDADAGRYPLLLRTSGGSAEIPFEISPRLTQPKKSRGITNDDIIYLIMPDRFANGDESNDRPAGTSGFANDRKNPRTWHGGDFKGIEKNIPYLKELGVTALWLTPWYDNPDNETNCDKPWCPNTNYHGYHAIDYYAVENRFGTMRDLQDFVAACQKNGIKVIQDQVSNHVGHTHEWMKNRPLENWFTPFVPNSFNNSVLLSPNSSPAERNNLIKGWFNEFLPDLNQAEPEVARYELQNTLWWIEMAGIDGIRQDTIQYMPREFIRDWSGAILKEYPDFWMVGEVFEEDSAQTAFFQGGRPGWDGIDTRLPAIFDFKLWRTSQMVFTGKAPARSLRDVLKYDGLYPNINNVVLLENNHDTDRFMSLPDAKEAGAKMHKAFVLSARGIPQLYYGEEILMTGGHDPDNRKDFPGGWQGDRADKFQKAGRTFKEQDMFEWTRDWISLRKQYPSIRSGRTVDLHYDDTSYVFARVLDDEAVVLSFALGDNNKNISLDLQNLGLGTTISVEQLFPGNPELRPQLLWDGKSELRVSDSILSVFHVTRLRPK